ncbi:hypothetical protein AXG93_3536s1090 [Marchantia polymorpha subsp. ruderalis]|uniref:Reverse transcriptase Ty1/copia-type domain-containing protein n=1 Tax=Marchantia polymorpha subsp. ruderalis TaxID=1480154 RepID=A0A176VEP6_MARPO|nr:hypothetical protein AXG93_3536s1090 [Marchantia polymorpha subsp. ruderalis]
MYKRKDNPTGNKARIFKARLVVRSFTQDKGVDYNKAAQCPTEAVEKERMSCVACEQAVCSLMSLMVCTRPDIAFAMSKKYEAQSTTAEYVAVEEAAKEAIWLDRFIIEMGLKQGVVNLHYDTKNALHLAANQVMDSIIKHIDIRYH